MIELATAIGHLHWAPRNAERVLGSRRVRPGLLVANLAATLEYQPYGVVGVIGPWNYPVFTPLGSIVYALAAGNAVVFKPSEYTPAVGRWLVDSFAAVVPEQPVLQLVTGGGADRRRAVPVRRGQDRVHRLDRDREEDHGRLRRDADPGAARVRRQGRDDRRRGRGRARPRPTRRSGAGWPTPARPASASSGCTRSTRSTTSSSPRWPSGPGRCARARTDRVVRAGHHAGPAGRDPPARDRRAGPRRPGGGRRRRRRCARRTRTRPCWSTCPRTPPR